MEFLKKIYQPWHKLRVRLHKRSYVLGALVHISSIIAVAFILIFVFTFYILQPYQVVGQSMQPTLQDGDRLFILRSGKIFSDIMGTDYIPKRGEIIVFHSSLKDNKWIKRVVGLPGERIVIKNNRITIYNDEFPGGFEPVLNLDPPLEAFPPNEQVVDRIIRKSEIFVIGDNRLPQQSSDSRGTLGNVSLEDVDGTVLIRVVPVSEFQLF